MKNYLVLKYRTLVQALMYLANNTRQDITFSVNLLARYSYSPTKRHWNGVKHVLRYLRRTIDMGLFYSNKSNFVKLVMWMLDIYPTHMKQELK